VLTALTKAADIREALQGCTQALVTRVDAAFARIWTLNEFDRVLELQASAGLYTHLDGGHARVPVGAFKIGLIALERTPHLTNDVVNDRRVSDRGWAAAEGMVSFAGFPLMTDGRLVGVIALFARRPLKTTSSTLWPASPTQWRSASTATGPVRTVSGFWPSSTASGASWRR